LCAMHGWETAADFLFYFHHSDTNPPKILKNVLNVKQLDPYVLKAFIRNGRCKEAWRDGSLAMRHR